MDNLSIHLGEETEDYSDYRDRRRGGQQTFASKLNHLSYAISETDKEIAIAITHQAEVCRLHGNSSKNFKLVTDYIVSLQNVKKVLQLSARTIAKYIAEFDEDESFTNQ